MKQAKWFMFFGAGALVGLLLMIFGVMGWLPRGSFAAIPIGVAVSVIIFFTDDSKDTIPSLRVAAPFGFVLVVVGMSLILAIAHI